MGGAWHIPDDGCVKEGGKDCNPNRHSADIIDAYNKHRNHFSKSTAQDSEIGVRDLENLLRESYDSHPREIGNNRISSDMHNNRFSNRNRFSSVVGS